MSLLRLLTTGKTLMGLKSPEHRYQLPGQPPLPKFGGKKNPFRATVFPEKAEAGELIPNGTCEGVTNTVPSVERTASSVPLAPVVTTPRVAAEQAQEPANGKKSPLRALLLWGRAKKPDTAKTQASRPLVQAELSLDKVKVVRNDLSESDFEIVPSRATSSEPRPEEARRDSRKTSTEDRSCLVVSAKM